MHREHLLRWHEKLKNFPCIHIAQLLLRFWTKFGVLRGCMSSIYKHLLISPFGCHENASRCWVDISIFTKEGRNLMMRGNRDVGKHLKQCWEVRQKHGSKERNSGIRVYVWGLTEKLNSAWKLLGNRKTLGRVYKLWMMSEKNIVKERDRWRHHPS